MNRRNAWAPVGIDIDGAKSIDDALRISGLDWTVEKKHVFDENGKEIPNWFRNVRSDDNSVLGMVGNKYQILQNRQAFDFTEALLGDGMEYEKAGDWKKGSAIWLEAKLPDDRLILGDKVESHVVFINSHDGKGAVKVCVVPTRLFCSNQLNFALHSAKRSWSATHAGDVRYKVKEAATTLELASKYMDALSEEAEALALQKLSENQFLDIVKSIYPIDEEKDSARKITSATESREALMAAYHEDDLANFKGTAYKAMMAVTDFVDHAEPLRETTSYWNNNWMKVATGHSTVDKFYTAIKASV